MLLTSGFKYFGEVSLIPIQRTAAQSGFLQMRTRALKFCLFPSQLHSYMLSHESSSNHLLKPLAFQLLLSTLLSQVTILRDWRKRPPIVCRFQDSLMLEMDLWLFHNLSALQNMVLWNYLCICITLHESLLYALSMLPDKIYYSILSYWEQTQKIVPLQEVNFVLQNYSVCISLPGIQGRLS